MPRYVTRGRKTRQARYKKRAPTRKYRRPTRPSYRRKSGGMSRKRILNVTSTKKQDNMLSFSNTDNTGGSKTVAAGGLYVNGAYSYGMSVWCATARSMVTAGVTDQYIDAADRCSATCYMRGLKENLRIQTNSPMPWLWRRIVFTTKGNTFLNAAPADTPTQTYRAYSDTSIGIARQWFNLQANSMPSTVNGFNGIIFKGTFNQDWNDVITAKVDTSRITVKSDRTCTIRTGNSNGHFSDRKLWYPMNANLVYDDDESGAGTTTQYFSTDAKAGMGDMFVIDYLVPGLGAASTDIINLNSTATLYWHEK
ncbi:capsid protein [Tortoise genomovirus 18]|nr:capsid protein [Tortoise genomovirus 18]